MKSITPSLWFDGNLEEAARFYASVFPGSSISGEFRQGQNLISADFTLAGQRFTGINGGPQFPFTEAVSFVVECDSQEEVDHYWAALTADGGQESQCGWLKDRFGLSWQIVPTEFLAMLSGPDPAAVQRVVDVMLTQHKLELAPLRAALRG
jgi:predicted 3-demethylubiquinone-9 3-methyltransferase (glyoxalase superfamily)